MRHALWPTLIFALAPALLRAQEPTPAAALEDRLADLLGRHDVPALGAAVIRDGRLAEVGVAGVRVRGRDAAVTVDDRWHLGSCTKAMTATLCARLVAARGDLSWDDLMPSTFEDLEVHDDLAEVTLPMLLSHRAGLVANPLLIWGQLRAHPGPTAAARALVAQTVLTRRPQHDPGSHYLYSNTGYMIAGTWLERITGSEWEALMRTEIFAPLGMRSAGFGPPGAEEFDADAAPRQPWAHGASGEPIAPGPDADNPPALGPAGTVHCTLADWAKFVAAHLEPGEGEEPFLTDEQRMFLHTPHDDLSDYAMGWGRIDGDEPALQHAGSNTMWFCIVRIVPETRSAALVTCNQGGDAAMAACQAALAALDGR